MHEIDVVAKKWGASLALLLPKELTQKEGISEGDTVHILVTKPQSLDHLFGSLKTKVRGQAFKDVARKGWD
ncbi:MAG: AbrB/MazE/SpoVT family DNA-binding domain-containing protein [Candidatus Bilamarchaeum sp.]|jgi:hypothetical protein